jgi:hypothetical protein
VRNLVSHFEGGTGFWLGSPKGRDHWEDLGVGGRRINLDLREIGIDGANLIQLVQDSIQ